jgi:hypothetical protein
MLLLLMLLVAIFFGVARFPWTETKTENGMTRTTHYRRGWDRIPLKHGAETFVDDKTGKRLREKHWNYGVLWRERSFDQYGFADEETAYLTDFTLERKFVTQRRPIAIVTQTWNDGRQHKSWQAPPGAELESYHALVAGDDLRIVRWNDVPIDEAMDRFLSPLPAADRQAWQEKIELKIRQQVTYLGDSTYEVIANSSSAAKVPLHGIPIPPVRFPAIGPPPLRDRPMIQDYLAAAHRMNRTLEVRFGVVCIVPIEPPPLNPAVMKVADPTGALAVRFEKDSPQEKAWLEKVIGMDQGVVPHAKRLQHYFADTGIEIDASQVNLRWEHRPNLADSTYLRTRRDTLGIFLWHHRLQVEQQGNKLMVVPRR